LRCLADYADWFSCDIHAYVLMCNHVHLLVTPQAEGGVGKLIQAVNRKFVGFVNYSLDRTGPLWGGRYKSCLVGTDEYALACYRYIELNPVRANIVRSAGSYRWSSFQSNALGAANDLLVAHCAYESLGSSPQSRRRAYFDWVAARGEADEQTIREVTNRQHAFASEDFRSRIEVENGRSMRPAKVGRPRKIDLCSRES
jgi:putative transposase